MKGRHVRAVSGIVLAAVFGAWVPVSTGADSENHKLVDGVEIYVGVMPADMILKHPHTRGEREMHGGVPAHRHRDHVVVALFDHATGKRIGDAQVSATVRELGLSGNTKTLEPMEIAETISYGNYFDMRSGDTYQILVRIHRPGVASQVEANFVHRHYE